MMRTPGGAEAATEDTAEPTTDAVDATAGRRKRPRVFYGWYMIGGMMGIHWYLSAAFVYGYGVLFVPILDTFGWSRTVGSLTALFMQPVGGAVGPAAGVLVDRYGARRVVFAGVLFMGFGIMSLSAMQALWMMFASFAMISIGMSATMGVGFNAALVNWFVRQRGRALGIGFSGAVVSGPFVGVVAWMEASYGWRDTVFMLGLGMLLIGIPSALLIRSKPSDMGLLPDGDDPADMPAATGVDAPPAAGPELTARQAMRDRNLWVLAGVYGLMNMSIAGFLLHQIPYFESLGYSRGEAASTLAFFTMLSVIGRVGVGWAMDVMGRRGMDLRLVPATLLAIQTVAFLIVAHLTAYWQVIPFALLFGIAFGGMLPSRPMITGALYGLRSFATIQGVLNLTVVPFAVAAPMALGLVFDQTGEYYVGVLLLAATSAAGIPLCFALRLPRTAAETS